MKKYTITIELGGVSSWSWSQDDSTETAMTLDQTSFEVIVPTPGDTDYDNSKEPPWKLVDTLYDYEDFGYIYGTVGNLEKLNYFHGVEIGGSITREFAENYPW